MRERSGGDSAEPPDDGAPDDGAPAPEEIAPSSALARARAAARARGLRPGLKPRRRRKDVPAGKRGDAGRDPALLGDQLERFVAERGWQVDVAVGSVVGRWPTIVGPDVSAHCAPTDFVDGVLTVRADSTAWATQLRMLSTSLIGRLADEVGEGTVIELRVLGPGAPSWSRGSRRVQDGRGPRDTYG
jgi:predicted nucleic acid-binding Zn ribbon protein